MSEKYFNDVLIRLRRIYSKDETVSALSKKISELEIEIGKLKSYIDELEDGEQLAMLYKKISNMEITEEKLRSDIKKISEMNINKKMKSIMQANKALKANNKELKRENMDLIKRMEDMGQITKFEKRAIKTEELKNEK